jgi:RNA polymerase sigma-70 factor, ECF subfamily
MAAFLLGWSCPQGLINDMDHNLADLVERYYAKVYKLALFYLGRTEDAEDATQQTFIKVLEKLDRFRGDADLFTWIYRIACNTAISMLRQRRFSAFLSLDGEQTAGANPGLAAFSPAPADPAHSLEDQQEAEARLAAYHSALERLTSREKSAFFLYHYEGVKQKEIAAIMQTSLSAVEALLHKALKKIRQAVGTRSLP